MTTLQLDLSPRIDDARKAEAKRADILPYLPGLKFHAKTKGGEYHGPCPVCGGKDRLIAWPNHPNGPRAACRKCHGLDQHSTLDAIALVQWLGRARSFPAAVKLLTGSPPAPFLAPPPQPLPPKPYRRPWPPCYEVAYYDYVDFDGTLLWQKVRVEPGFKGETKSFLLRTARPGITHPRNDHPEDWYSDRLTDRLLPYNLRAAWGLAIGAPLLWVDGEKDVETARAAGVCAVCGPDGKDTWQDEWAPLFLDHPALIIPDAEPGGLEVALRVAAGIEPFTPTVKLVAVPAKDLTAWLNTLRPMEGISHAA